MRDDPNASGAARSRGSANSRARRVNDCTHGASRTLTLAAGRRSARKGLRDKLVAGMVQSNATLARLAIGSRRICRRLPANSRSRFRKFRRCARPNRLALGRFLVCQGGPDGPDRSSKLSDDHMDVWIPAGAAGRSFRPSKRIYRAMFLTFAIAKRLHAAMKASLKGREPTCIGF